MFFSFNRPPKALARALREAIATHRPVVVQALLESHGAAKLAAALAECSPRVIDDALTMLPLASRKGVARGIPGAITAKCRSLSQQHPAVSSQWLPRVEGTRSRWSQWLPPVGAYGVLVSTRQN